MDELLKLWNLPEEVIAAFQRNAIDESHLPHLGEEQLKELCPTMGIRINKKKKIAEFLESQAPTESITEFTDASSVRGELQEISVVDDISFALSDIFPCQSTFGDFDLNTLLTTTPCGKSILQYYTVNGCLDTKRRNRLTDTIIRHLFTHIVNHKLTYEDYNIIAGKIITLFPKETAATYFTKPIKKCNSHTGKSVAARGKSIDKIRNVLIESGECKRKKIDSSEPTGEPSCKKPLNTSQLVNHGQRFLKSGEQLLRHVMATMASNSKTSRTCMIAQWSILNHSSAAELNPADIKKTVTDQQEKAYKRKQPVQPYLIILGSFQNITQLYLVADKIRYTFTSTQRAFDSLFKSYHLFNAKYHKAGDHILLIVQRCVYEIETKYDNVVPYIADILNLK